MTKIKAKPEDGAYAFVATSTTGNFRPYYLVIKKNGNVFIESHGMPFFHMSLHKPKDDSGYAGCHYAIPKEYIKDGVVNLMQEDDSGRLFFQWNRKIGQQAPESACRLVFPAQNAVNPIDIPLDIHRTPVQNFTVSSDHSLNVEILFGPKNQAIWDARFHNYGDSQLYFDLNTDERICLNIYKDSRAYDAYQRTENHQSVAFINQNGKSESREKVHIGPSGKNSVIVVHGEGEFLPERVKI